MKTLWHRRFLPVLFVLLWLGCSLLPDASALDPVLNDRFQRNLQLIIRAHPRYVWGGKISEARGLDCSGYMYLAAKRSAWPVGITTSYRMALGFAGWRGEEITLDLAGPGDLVWWTWKDKPLRPHGHVGALIHSEVDGFPGVTHASSSRGVIATHLTGQLLRDLSMVRRLKIGEP